VERAEKESIVLQKTYPRSFLNCDGRASSPLRLTPKVAAGGILQMELVQAGEATILLTDLNDPAFSKVIDHLPHRDKVFPEWAPAKKFSALRGAVVVQDSNNAYFPGVLGHRYYLLPKWEVTADRKNLRWTRAPRWDLKQREKGEKIPDDTREELEMARWESPEMVAIAFLEKEVPQGLWGIHQKASAFDAAVGTLEDLFTLMPYDQGPILIDISYRLSYTAEGLLTQRLELEVDDKGLITTLRAQPIFLETGPGR
jgi:hypothetical protein